MRFYKPVNGLKGIFGSGQQRDSTAQNYLLPQIFHETPLAAHGDYCGAFILHPVGVDYTCLIIRPRVTISPPVVRLQTKPMQFLTDFLPTRSMLMDLKVRGELKSTQI